VNQARELVVSAARQGITSVYLKNRTGASVHPSKTTPSPDVWILPVILLYILLSRKHEALTKSLRKMERTLDTVLRTMANPGLTSLASGMVSASPSPPPDDDIKTTHDLVTELTSAPPPPAYHLAASTVAVARQPGQSTYGGGAVPNHPGTSPKLHSLPDNALNPLGLLAEASLANRRAQQAAASATPSSSPSLRNRV